MKRPAGWILLLVAALAPAAIPAGAAEPVAAEAAVAVAGLFCEAGAPATELPAVEAAGLFTPPPEPKAICTVGCVDDDYCRRDSDCTAAPGGHCNLICPKNGCCVY